MPPKQQPLRKSKPMMEVINKRQAADYLGVSPREMTDTRDGVLHPIYSSKGGEPNFAEWELKRLKNLGDGNESDVPPLRQSYPPIVWDLFVCPWCHGRLVAGSSGVACAGCAETYTYSSSGALDLRLRRPKQQSVEFMINSPLIGDSTWSSPLAGATSSESQWYKQHWPKPPEKPSVALELGCADILQKTTLEQSGFEYLGVDYDAIHAQMLVDAHALPFSDNSFPFIIASQVLEHLSAPGGRDA